MTSLRLDGWPKAFLENTGAEQDHENLIVRYSRPFIHGVEAIEDADNLLLTEEW